MGDDHRRKPFQQCSRRHKRRIIQEDIKKVYSQNLQYRQLNDNRLEVDPHNISYDDALNISSFVCTGNEVEQVLIANNENLWSLEKNFDRNGQNDIEFLENDRESNIQLLDFLSIENIEKDNDEYWEELMNENYEYYQCIFNETSDVNELSDANTQFDEKLQNFILDLHNWALHNNISQKAINELLKLLLRCIPNCSLPTDARTLLSTPRTTNCTSTAGGEYLHFGLSNVINLLMKNYTDAGLDVNNITFSLNIDGLPISRSSSHCLWPILISDEILKSVHMIGIDYGVGKPISANNFLEQFINELKIFIQDGFMYGKRRINIILSTIICDAPAKSFILYTKSHNGFSSCSKCTIVGEYIQRTMCFPYTKTHTLRTDEDFFQQTDEEYHQGETLLLQIPNIGLVSAVALDYMHLVCLGVVKKLLLLWMKGPLRVRIRSTNTNLISQRLIALRSSIPKEFSRKPRSLSEIKYWKATEFR